MVLIIPWDAGHLADATHTGNACVWFAVLHWSLGFSIVVTSMVHLCFLVHQRERQARRWDFANQQRQQQQQQLSQARSQPSSVRQSVSRSFRRSSSSAIPSGNVVVLSHRTMETGILHSLTAMLAAVPPILMMCAPVQSRAFLVVQMANVTLVPLQGFFNVLICTKPTWRPVLTQWHGSTRSCPPGVNAFVKLQFTKRTRWGISTKTTDVTRIPKILCSTTTCLLVTVHARSNWQICLPQLSFKLQPPPCGTWRGQHPVHRGPCVI